MQSLSGQREKKREEPRKEISHQDFLMKEMQDMAQDFHEETYFKRYMLTKLAYEAQSVALQKMRDRAKNDKEYQVKVISGPKADIDEDLDHGFVDHAHRRLDDDFLAGPGPRPDLNIQTGREGFPGGDHHGDSPDAFLGARPGGGRCPLLDQ